MASKPSAFNVVDRSADAHRVVEYLLQAERQLAVLYGRRGSRRRELIREWILPQLEGKREAYYAECSPLLPKNVIGVDGELSIDEALRSGAVVFLGRMERFLSVPDPTGRARFLELLTRGGENETPGTLVLVIPEQSLIHVLALQDVAPSLMENILEIGVVTFRDSMQALSRGTAWLTYDSEAIDALAQEVEQNGTVDAVELAVAINQGFQSFKGAPDTRITLADCKAIGGVGGALDEFRKVILDKAIDCWGPDADKNIEVILAAVVSSSKQGISLEVEDLASRLGIRKTALSDVLTWLCGEGQLLRDDGTGQLTIIPAELSAGIEQIAASHQQDVKRAGSLLRNGVRSWSELGALLPQKRLDEIQTTQEWLTATDDEATLMVRSLLQVHEPADTSSVCYWLQRIRSRTGQTSALIEGLFAESPTVRRRAAELLGDFDERDVLRQLHRVVTEDPDRDVRQVALASLGKMQLDELWPVISHEARQLESPYQRNAVASLCLFHNEALALLRELASSSDQSYDVRAEAINTLAAIGSTESVRTLVEIGLNANSATDRATATKALVAISSKDRAREAIAAIRDATMTLESSGPITLRGAVQGLLHLVLSSIITVINLFVHGAALLALRRYRSGLLFFGVELVILAAKNVSRWEGTEAWVVLLLLMNWLASQLAATRVSFVQEKIVGGESPSMRVSNRPVRSSLGTSLLAVLLLFDLIPFFLVHGLAQGLAGRSQRAIKLFALECFGVLCGIIAWYYFTPNFTWITAFPPKISQGLLYVYGCVGVLLFLGTFFWDLGPVIYDLVTDRRGRGGWKRRIFLYEAMANNRWSAEYLLECAAQLDNPYKTWARRVVRRTGRLMPADQVILSLKVQNRRPDYLVQSLRTITDGAILKALAAELKAATPPLRRWIVDVLAGKPSEASLEQLRLVRNTLGWYGRLRYGVGLWHYRLRVWPSTVLVISVLLVPLPLLSAYEAAQTSINPGRPVLRMVQAEGIRWKHAKNGPLRMSADQRMTDDQLLETLQFLANVDEKDDPELLNAAFKESTAEERDIWSKKPVRVAKAICTLPSEMDPPQQRRVDALRDELVSVLAHNVASKQPDAKKALSIIEEDTTHCGISDRSGSDLVRAASTVLQDSTSPQDMSIAVAALDAAGTPNAVEPLRRIVAQLPSRQDIQSREKDPKISDQLQWDNTRRAALSAINNNPSHEADQALDMIKNSFDHDIAKLAGDFIAQRDKQRANQHYESLVNRATAAYQRAVASGGSGQTTTLAITYLNEIRKTGQWSGDKSYMLSTAYVLRAESTARQFEPGDTSVNARAAMRDAFADARMAKREDPTSALAYCVEAWLLQRDRRPRESIGYLSTAISKQADFQWSYDLLYDAYISQANMTADPGRKQARLKEGAAQFESLIKRYPNVMWPQSGLARIYHDNLFDFARSYELLRVVEQRFGPVLAGQQKQNLDANFLESCFTVGHYQEAQDAAAKLDTELDVSDYELRIPTGVYRYMGLAMQGYATAAESQLSKVELLVRKLPPDYELGWSYEGTVQYLRSRQPQDEVAERLADLADSANGLQKYRRLSPLVIGANRAALRAARVSADHVLQ
jgi:HEAT repeat protein